ncbi:MAG: type II toxin-antitoxin system RelB/DinJ family antitoxin [Succinivibrio sp.]|nr:type II toxin-antitoxin system RelB/DinJ family antitoxin [Succinivibrio sp.]
MDSSLKQQMDSICSELGMSLTTAFTIFAKKVCREKNTV